MHNLAENIRKFRKLKCISQEQLATYLGFKSFTTIQKWETGVSEPNLGTLYKLADYFNVSIKELLENEKESNENNPTEINFYSKEYNYVEYPVSAGCLEQIEAITEFQKIKIPDALLGKYAGNKHLLFTHINGESMNNTIQNGALIAINQKTEYTNLKDGDIVVIATDEGYSCKRFFNDKDNQRFIFKPDSSIPTFMPISVNYEEGFQLIGKVVMYNVLL